MTGDPVLAILKLKGESRFIPALRFILNSKTASLIYEETRIANDLGSNWRTGHSVLWSDLVGGSKGFVENQEPEA